VIPFGTEPAARCPPKQPRGETIISAGERAPLNALTPVLKGGQLEDASRSHAAVRALVTALVLAASGHPANAPIADPEERSAARRVRVCGEEQDGPD